VRQFGDWHRGLDRVRQVVYIKRVKEMSFFKKSKISKNEKSGFFEKLKNLKIKL
jgi:hypothetical protein